MWVNILKTEAMVQEYIVFGSSRILIKCRKSILGSGNLGLTVDMELLKKKGNLNILGNLKMIKYVKMILSIMNFNHEFSPFKIIQIFILNFS